MQISLPLGCENVSVASKIKKSCIHTVVAEFNFGHFFKREIKIFEFYWRLHSFWYNPASLAIYTSLERVNVSQDTSRWRSWSWKTMEGLRRKQRCKHFAFAILWELQIDSSQSAIETPSMIITSKGLRQILWLSSFVSLWYSTIGIC